MENPNINYVNLARMADYIETIPQKMFTMKVFIDEEAINREGMFTIVKYIVERSCNTIGCAIGHCVVLDTNIPRFKSGEYNYAAWLYRFTGIEPYGLEYGYLFGPWWSRIDNTPQGAAQRIRTFTASGVPEDWGIEFLKNYHSI